MHVGFLGLGAIGAPMAAHLSPRLHFGRSVHLAADRRSLAACGVAFADAPVSGGTNGAEAAWPRTFRLALLDKDVGIATDLLAETGLEGALFERCASALHAARVELGEAADSLDPIRRTERLAGVKIRG